MVVVNNHKNLRVFHRRFINKYHLTVHCYKEQFIRCTNLQISMWPILDDLRKLEIQGNIVVFNISSTQYYFKVIG